MNDRIALAIIGPAVKTRKPKSHGLKNANAAHVATDVTIHPVVQLKSKGDSTQHRLCELNQDAYIWDRLGIGEIGAADHFAGLDGCYSGLHLDPDVERLWSDMLERTYPAEWRSNRPLVAAWHQAFKLVIDKVVSRGRAIPFGRHLAWGANPRTRVNASRNPLCES